MNSLFLWIKITKLLSAIDSVLSFFSLIIAQYLSIFQRSFFIDYKFITHYRCFNQFFIVISFFVVAGFSSESSLRCQLRRRSTHWRLWNPICPRLEPSRHGIGLRQAVDDRACAAAGSDLVPDGALPLVHLRLRHPRGRRRAVPSHSQI